MRSTAGRRCSRQVHGRNCAYKIQEKEISRYAIAGENDTDVVSCTRNTIFGVQGICSVVASPFSCMEPISPPTTISYMRYIICRMSYPVKQNTKIGYLYENKT